MKQIIVNNVTHMTMIGDVRYGNERCAANYIHDLMEEQAISINMSSLNQEIVKRGGKEGV